jgi:hypothetical protein
MTSPIQFVYSLQSYIVGDEEGSENVCFLFCGDNGGIELCTILLLLQLVWHLLFCGCVSGNTFSLMSFSTLIIYYR